ncbi:MAG: SBBP repeat-containing protein [Bryobacterales bacterium]|nr:SBBP repeat-containing protein [Bryobacterales bacterium]
MGFVHALSLFAVCLGAAAELAAAPTLASLPLRFEPNRGQAGKSAAFAARSGKMALSLSATGATIAFRNGETVAMTVEGANAAARMEPEQPLEGTSNYLLGTRREDWISGIPGYGRVRAKGVYPGIDVVFYGKGGMVEYDFVVAPQADPKRIGLRFEGAKRLELDASGDLVIETQGGQLRHRRPVVYQEANGQRKEIAGAYRIERGNRVRFEVGAYDKALPLVLDPVLSYSTYLGSSGDEGNYGALAVDATGATYIAGESVRLTGQPGDYPTTSGALRTTSTTGTRSDAVITKLSSDGSRLVYSTYIGGSAGDVITRLALVPDGTLYFLGHTDSTDFPTTAGVMQMRHAGGRFDLFLGRLNADGSQLMASTYIGGAGADLSRGLIYTEPRIIVGMQTESSGFPTSTGAAQAARAGATDLYILGVRPDLSAPVTATYFGGAGADELNDVRMDGLGNILATGRTASANFPTTGETGARSGPHDVFVVKLDTAFRTVIFSRLIGGEGTEAGIGITSDPSNNVYVAGDTNSSNFPTTAGAFQTSFKGGVDGFVAKLTPAGGITYVTLLGGNGEENAFALAADNQGSVAVAGFSFSTDFPLTADAWQTASGAEYAEGYGDAYLALLNPSGSALRFSTLLGGNFSEESQALVVSDAGVATWVGFTQSDDWPVTAGAIKPTLGACRTDLDSDCQRMFVAKVDLNRAQAAGPRVLLNGVVGAADYMRGGVSPGDVITIFGSDLGPAALVGLRLEGGLVARELGGTRVLFDDVPAALVYSLAGQVSAVVPYSFGERQTTTLVVEYQGRRSNPVILPLRGSKMGLFTANSSGSGQAAALNADNSVNGRTNAVARGSVIVLYGTGMGMLNPAPPIGGVNGVPLARAVGTVTATIGGKTATVLYAGGAPGLIAGVVQVNLQVPADAPTGDAVAVEVLVDGFPSQLGVTIAVR